MQIAIVLYPGFTALDFIGPYEVLRNLPDAEVRFVWHEPGPIEADSGVLLVGATHSFDETPSPDVILVPGGPMPTGNIANKQKAEVRQRFAEGLATRDELLAANRLLLNNISVLGAGWGEYVRTHPELNLPAKLHEELTQMIADGMEPQVNVTYTLDQLPEALTDLAEGRILGKAVVKIGE